MFFHFQIRNLSFFKSILLKKKKKRIFSCHPPTNATLGQCGTKGMQKFCSKGRSHKIWPSHLFTTFVFLYGCRQNLTVIFTFQIFFCEVSSYLDTHTKNNQVYICMYIYAHICIHTCIYYIFKSVSADIHIRVCRYIIL